MTRSSALNPSSTDWRVSASCFKVSIFPEKSSLARFFSLLSYLWVSFSCDWAEVRMASTSPVFERIIRKATTIAAQRIPAAMKTCFFFRLTSFLSFSSRGTRSTWQGPTPTA